jgi:cyclase
MRRVIGWTLSGLLVLAAVGGIYLYQKVATIRAEPVTGDVWALFGLGGNVGVLRTDRGAVVVDTMSFRMQGDAIRQRVEALTGREVEVILNTHYHRDHTHGNPAFPAGTRVVATTRTLDLLRTLDAGYFSGAAAQTLPNETFGDHHEIHLGGKTIEALHPGRGHTGGDLVVLFVEDRVLHAGDLFFNHLYPSVDLEAGGSVREWADTLDRVLALDFDRVIPGHGAISDRAGLVQFQRFLRELWSQVDAAAKAGESLDQTLASVHLTEDAGYQPIEIPGVVHIDRDSVIRRAWEEATGRVKPVRAEPAGAAGR